MDTLVPIQLRCESGTQSNLRARKAAVRPAVVQDKFHTPPPNPWKQGLPRRIGAHELLTQRMPFGLQSHALHRTAPSSIAAQRPAAFLYFLGHHVPAAGVAPRSKAIVVPRTAEQTASASSSKPRRDLCARPPHAMRYQLMPSHVQQVRSTHQPCTLCPSLGRLPCSCQCQLCCRRQGKRSLLLADSEVVLLLSLLSPLWVMRLLSLPLPLQQL
mmetsp:Transcript_92015/g.182779  ORF Transcript_92015/g.182779 Transcript_92015/m.182779 type:complete len:214 (-) Transcript_92015:3000-3641(-)